MSFDPLQAVLSEDTQLLLGMTKDELETPLAPLSSKKTHCGLRMIHVAAYRGLQHTLKTLLERGVEVDSRSQVGWTALFYACKKGHEACVRLLLAHNANVNATGYTAGAPLTLASQGGHLALVQFLLDHSANINIQDAEGLSPLYMAVYRRQSQVVQLLCEKGADPNLVGPNGQTPLFAAVASRAYELMRTLHAHKANINHQDKFGNSAAHLSVVTTDLESLDVLRELGIDLSLVNKDSHTAEALADLEGQQDIRADLAGESCTNMDLQLEDLGDFLQSAQEVFAALPDFIAGISGPALLTFVKNCLFVFLQANCTGPPLDLPKGDRSTLGLDGEEVTSDLTGAQFIAAASDIVRHHFARIEECRLAHLWAARAISVHQRCLLNQVPTLKTAALEHYELAIQSESDPRARAEICVEAAHVALFYYKYNRAEELLTEAQTLTGLKFWLTGKMGYRTKYQKTPTAQLVLETESQAPSGLSVQTPESVSLEFDPDNILHETPVLVEPTQTTLSVLDQCVLLGVAQHLVKSRHADETQREQVGAYLESTLGQSLNWLVYSTSLLYRSRNQFENYKTKERSSLQLKALIDQFKEAEPPAADRLRFYFACDFPLRYWQHFEMGEMWMRLGCAASALEMFERVEMHEEAIECLLITEQPNKAKEMALRRLEVAPTPRLLCTLGDITNDESYYHRAWEVSRSCSRAQRTLARRAFERKEFETCVEHYTKALEVNPLFNTAWFTKGCALMKLERWEDAAHAFVQVVGLDDGQADAWNNLAACRIREGKQQEAYVALEQGLRHSRRNWKMWENMLNLAMSLRKVPSVLEAFDTLIDLKHFESLKDPVFRVMWVIGAKEGKYARVFELFTKYSNSVSPGPFFWKVFADLLCAGQQPLNQLEIIQLRIKACRALMKVGWERNEQACEELINYVLEVAQAYAMLDNEPAKVEGRLFVQMAKEQITAALHRDIVFPPF